MRSQRQLRVGEAIRHALAGIFQRGDVPWPKGFIPPMITITEVQISPDLHNASIFYLAMGEQNGRETAQALKNIVGFFRHELAHAVKLRYVPELSFKPDTSFDYATTIDKILSDPTVAKDVAPTRRDEDEAF